MRRYRYRALSSDNTLCTGELPGRSKEEVLALMKRRGLYPLSLRRANIWHSDIRELLPAGRLSPKVLSHLSGRLGVLLEAGLDLYKALDILARQTADRYTRSVLEALCFDILTGKPLAEAFAEQSCFPSFFVAMVNVGEQSGNLPQVFAELSDFYAWEDKSLRDIQSALLYPAIVAFLMLCAIVVALAFVIPSYARLFESFDAALPLPTRLLMSVGSFMADNVPALFLGLLLLIFLLVFFFRTPWGKYCSGYLLLNLPIIKLLSLPLLNYRFAKVSSILLQSGARLIPALQAAFPVLDNAYLMPRLDKLKQEIQTGAPLSHCLRQVSVFDAFLVGMAETGEETGRLPEMLNSAATYMKDQFAYRTQRLNTLIEPIITLILGSLLGFVMLAVILPSFSMMNAF